MDFYSYISNILIHKKYVKSKKTASVSSCCLSQFPLYHLFHGQKTTSPPDFFPVRLVFFHVLRLSTTPCHQYHGFHMERSIYQNERMAEIPLGVDVYHNLNTHYVKSNLSITKGEIVTSTIAAISKSGKII